MNTKIIPNSLRLYRKNRGLKQRDVALILGVRNASMISRWEKGLAIPSTVNVLKLAMIYRTSADALFIDYRLKLREEIQRKEETLKISN
jgi:transcriptional regulator with XRE-family HTH domain